MLQDMNTDTTHFSLQRNNLLSGFSKTTVTRDAVLEGVSNSLLRYL